MDKTVLVESHIQAGRSLLDALEKSGFNLTFAFWYFNSDENKWVLCVVNSDIDKNGALVYYMKLFSILNKLNLVGQIQNDDLLLVDTQNSIYKEICSRIKPSSMSNDIQMKDAYIYYINKKRR